MKLAVLAFPVLLLVAAAAPTKSENLAELYGRALGAAAECNAISRQRLDATATLASARIKALAGATAEQAAAGAALAKGVDRGARDVVSGATTCVQAESEFGNLERELAAPR